MCITLLLRCLLLLPPLVLDIAGILLRAADRYFELNHIHSFPFFYRRIGKFVMIDERFTYLAVAESRQFFALISTCMSTKCKQDLYTVCLADMMLKTAGGPNY